MKMNTFLKLGMATTLLLGAANCSQKVVEDKPFITLLLSNAIKSAASGNCAVSLNLATLYSGAVLQNAINTATTFTQAEFQEASGTTVGTGQTYETYASVPYNVKYDAFIRGGGTYNDAARTADINTGKAGVDLVALALLNASATSSFASVNATTFGVAQAFWNTYSDAEKTAIGAAAAAASSNAVTLASLNTAYGSLAAYGASLGGGLATFFGGVITAAGGQLAAGAAYQARQAFANGGAVLACGRIPRSSCTFAALTTADRATAVTNGVTNINNVANNTDCRKPNADFINSLIRSSFTGLPRGQVITGLSFRGNLTASPTDSYIAISEGGTASLNTIFAERAYPVSSALSAISTNFNVAFPLRVGTTKQTDGNGTIAYYGGSNINLSVVDTCEAFGLAPFGQGTNKTNSTTLQAYKTLTSTAEVAYAFSPQNSAATLYSALRGAVQGTPSEATNDAIACNNSFRSRFSIPLAIGGGKLPVINAVSGDGSASALLTTCVYGGTTASLETTRSLLANVITGITACPATAKGAAALFGDTGVDTLANFPNN